MKVPGVRRRVHGSTQAVVVLTVAEIGTVLEALDCLERSRVPILMTDARGRELRRMTLIRETLRDAVKSIR